MRLPVIAFAYGTQDCSLVAARKLTACRELMLFDPAQPDFFVSYILKTGDDRDPTTSVLRHPADR